MSSVLPTYTRFACAPVRGEGVFLWDAQQKRYLDFCSGIATCSLGHCHPALTQAIAQQASVLVHCSNLYSIAGQEEVASLLNKHFLQRDGRVFFSNSGAESNDGMIKVARRYGHRKPSDKGEPRTQIITFKQSFHGRTLGSMAATGQKKIQEEFAPLLEGFEYVAYNDSEALKQAISSQTVAIMLEAIQGEGGVMPATKDFLQTIQACAKEHDLLILCDEIQCGVGRTGTPMGYQSIWEDFLPDVVSFAKGLGGGFPIGAFWVSSQPRLYGNPLWSMMAAGSHGSTYGGNPLACAAAKAVLTTIIKQDLIANAAEQGAWIQATIRSWSHPLISEVRGAGLLIGVELGAFDVPAASTPALFVTQRLLEAGLLAVPAGAQTVRIVPALTITREQCLAGLALFKEVLDSIEMQKEKEEGV